MHRYRVGVTTVCPGLIESDLIKNTHFKLVDEQTRALSTMFKPMPAAMPRPHRSLDNLTYSPSSISRSLVDEGTDADRHASGTPILSYLYI
jgi:short-subunit dehydrogenase